MIAAYLLILIISIVVFYFTSDVVANAIIRFAISAAIFIIFSIIVTVIVSRGHATPQGAKTIDFKEMEKTRRELNKEDR